MSLLSLLGLGKASEPLSVGAPAPEVVAQDQDGARVDLGAIFRQGLTLVYFYPKASTPGCTLQACSLRDSITDLKGLGVRVLGVSSDKPAAQKRFQERFQLPFTLIADTTGEIIQAFGVPTIAFGIPRRQSFLIQDGRIAWRSLSAQTRKHADEVRKAIASLPN